MGPSLPLQVSKLTGPAAAAVKSARAGQAVNVTARGTVVARIVPVDEEVRMVGGMRVHGSGRNFRIPEVVARMIVEGTLEVLRGEKKGGGD